MEEKHYKPKELAPAIGPEYILRPIHQAIPIEPMYRVPEVSCQLGMSEDWTRRYFGAVPGVKVIKSPAKRGRRAYSILLIPASVLEREVRKLSQ